MVGLHEWRKAHETAIDANKKHVQEKQQKVAMIEVAHAVVHPWTMVVHSHDASLAHMAMMGSLWLWDFTRLAPSAEALASGRSSLVSQLSQCLGVHIGRGRRGAGRRDDGKDVVEHKTLEQKRTPQEMGHAVYREGIGDVVWKDGSKEEIDAP